MTTRIGEAGLRPSGAAGLLLSLAFGLVFFFVVTPPGFVSGETSYWRTQLEDIAQYYSGYRAYLAAPWTLPLLSIPSLNWPLGTVVTFVDAIPLFALLCKTLAPILPLPDNPFGVWVLLCYGLQGVGAWYAISQLRKDDWLALGLTVFLCVLMPSLTARMGHLSLQAHFLLLFAIGLYFRSRRTEKAWTGSWTLLLVVGFYINFYLTAMAIAIMAAAHLDLYLRTREPLTLLRAGVPLLAIAASVPPMLGLAFGTAVPDTGFGFYSMNLLSPLVHGDLIQMPFYTPGTEGQYEGYNYLGLGLVAALAAAVLLAPPPPAEARPGRFLILVLIGLFLYALSNEIYLGPIHLLRWDVPEALMPLFEAFRSSGRFFWPVSYVLVLYAVVRLSGLPLLGRIALAAAVVSVQAADLRPTLAAIKSDLYRAENLPLDIEAWNRELDGVQTIHAFPKFRCHGALMREIMPLQVLAATGGYNLTTGFISRYGADCDAIEVEIAQSDPAMAAYVFTRAHFTDSEIQRYIPGEAACRQLDIWVVCRVEPRG